jgi:biotin synthase
MTLPQTSEQNTQKNIITKNISTAKNWQLAEVLELFNSPFNDLIFKAQTIHRENFDANKIQISTLLSIKTGGCPEDCKYCPQSAHYATPVKATKLLEVEKVLAEARKAKDAGAGRFCMGAAWRSPKDKDIPTIAAMIKGVKDLGLETCMTLGMLSGEQANELADAGLDYYNHNLDTSEDFYHHIISTRTYSDRLNTLENVRQSGMKICSGGIVGMGEQVADRANMLITLANLNPQPESVPINLLVQVEGTPLADSLANDSLQSKNHSAKNNFDFIRTIAVARILMPKSYVRLSAGREDMPQEAQALAFLAGANSIFYGEKLLTTPNPSENSDKQLMAELGLSAENNCAQ